MLDRRAEIAVALKTFYDRHRGRDSRKNARLVVYAAWMAVSRSVDYLEKCILCQRVISHLSDDIFELTHDEIAHAKEVCRYVSGYIDRQKRMTGRKRAR